MSSSDIDNTAKRARRAVYDARFARAHDGSVTKPVWRSGQPAAAPAAAERRHSAAAARGTRNWPLWIVIAVGSAALVTAGYLGALVQLGATRAEIPASDEHAARPEVPASVEHHAAPSPPAEPAAPTPLPPPPVSVQRAAVPPAPTPEPARAEASAPKPKPHSSNPHSTNAEAAALATAALERELYGEQPQSPVVTVRALPQAEATEPGRAQPSREAVQQALLAMRPQLEACASGRHGEVDAALSIAGTGRVTYTLIRGVFAGTAEGSCMARALRAATFPSFSGPVFKVQFPFAL